jgi:serine/threonine-protein kinase
MRADLLRFTEGRPVQAAAGAFRGDDATRAVSVVAGERTQAVPVQSGPRTDVVRRRKASRTRTYVFGGLSALLIIAFAGVYFLRSSSVTNMPDLIGLSISRATGILTNDGLVVGGTTLVKSDKPAGTVVSTDPKAGAKVTSGQSVKLRVSLGQSSQPVSIPDVTTMSLSDAEAQLQQANLSYRVTFTSTATSNAQPNTVLYQDPVGGSAGHTGDIVTLTVLAPGSKFPLPDVVGQTALAAASTLGQSGLTIDPTQGSQCSNTVAQGLVASTTPTVGQPVASGDKITLNISSGYCLVWVPGVVNFSKAAATSAMQGVGLVVTWNTLSPNSASCSGKSDEVISQDPVGGSQAQYNSVVNLTYCPVTAG